PNAPRRRKLENRLPSAPSAKNDSSETTHEPLSFGKSCHRSSSPNVDDASKRSAPVRKNRSANPICCCTKYPSVAVSKRLCDTDWFAPRARSTNSGRAVTSALTVSSFVYVCFTPTDVVRSTRWLKPLREVGMRSE